MRVLRTTTQLHDRGLTRGVIRSGERQGRWRRIIYGVYGAGPDPPSSLDVARATALATMGVAVESLAGVLLGFDGVQLTGRNDVLVDMENGGRRQGVRRVQSLPSQTLTMGQVSCTDGPTTLWALAGILNDEKWEQALESAVRSGLVTRDDIAAMTQRRERRVARVRRVVAARGGLESSATESLLETLMVQLARTVPGLPPPERQVVVYDEHGRFVARVDLAWPTLGLFIELDGQHHAEQPLYDANRETAVVVATGWLCGRFTWDELTRTPTATARRLAGLLRQALRRPIAAQ